MKHTKHVKQQKKTFRHFFLRSAAGFLACAIAVGAASTAAFCIYETKCAQTDAAFTYRNLTNKLEDMDIPTCTDNRIHLQLALHAVASSDDNPNNEVSYYTDKAILLYDAVNQRLIDSSPIAWALIKGVVETPEDIPDSPDLADAETGEYFDGDYYFKKDFYSTDPEMIHAMNPCDKMGMWIERKCHEIYAKGDMFWVGPGELDVYTPVLDRKAYHTDFDFTPADKENYTHICDNDWDGDNTKVPEDAIGIKTLFLIDVGSDEDGTALAEVRHMYEYGADADDIYMPSEGYTPLKAPGGICIAMHTISDNRSADADYYYGYYVAYYHFWTQWHWHLIFFYAALLILAAVLALLTGKIKYQNYSKQYELNEYRRKLTGTLAHDLKSPLTAISGYAETLRDNINNEKREHYADSIVQTAAHMDSIIADVLTLAKLEDSGMPQTETLDLCELAKKSFSVLQNELDERKLTVQFSGTCSISANARMMNRAIDNLAANAVQYTPKGGCIDVSGQTGLFRIVNDADTSQIEDAETLCEPFVKGDKARTSRSGTGMGLAIVRQTVRMHGMRFSVKTDNGKFTAEIKA